MFRFVVLLRHGALEFLACDEEDIFRVARLKNAGICGVFDNRISAERFIDSQQQFLASPLEKAASCAGTAN